MSSEQGEIGGKIPGLDAIDPAVLQELAVCEWDFDALPALETATLDAYLAGLADEGYAADPDAVRLGFAAEAALCVGAITAAFITLFGPEEMYETDLQKFGHPPEEMMRLFVAMEEYALDRADEARKLMVRLDPG